MIGATSLETWGTIGWALLAGCRSCLQTGRYGAVKALKNGVLGKACASLTSAGCLGGAVVVFGRDDIADDSREGKERGCIAPAVRISGTVK